MRTLDVPTTSITEVKRSPIAVFERSQESGNGVYVLSHGTVSGVMLTREQYEHLVHQVEELEEALVLQEAAYRLREEPLARYTDDEVRSPASRATQFSEEDGWE